MTMIHRLDPCSVLFVCRFPCLRLLTERILPRKWRIPNLSSQGVNPVSGNLAKKCENLGNGSESIHSCESHFNRMSFKHDVSTVSRGEHSLSRFETLRKCQKKMKKHLGNTCEHLEFRLSEAKKVLASDELVSNLKMDGVNTLPETNRHSS